MPTYDYECKKCDHRWELFQSITANPVRKCPECGKLSAKRVIGPGAGVIFRGTGFYQTDYRSDSYKKAAEADKKPADSAGKSATKSESGSTTAAKSDSASSSD